MINWDYWNNERDRILLKKYDGVNPLIIKTYIDNVIDRDYWIFREYDEATGPTLDDAELFLKERCSDLGCDAIINYKTQYYAVGEDILLVQRVKMLEQILKDMGFTELAKY